LSFWKNASHFSKTTKIIKSNPMKKFPLAHTYSIIARDPETGEMGGAVQSHWFSVGSLVIWAESGIGVVATQAMAKASYGPLGLDLMRAGVPAPAALQALLVADELSAVRQVAMVDAQGRAAAHTGERCMAAAGHILGESFTTEANMMAQPTVWPAMAEAFRACKGDLAERLLAALDAAQSCGGDIRGQQSAAILVVPAKPSGQPWADRTFDLRVEDHPEPLKELRRLVQVQRAYALMNLGDERMAAGDISRALAAYSSAAALAPEMIEIPFWHAVTLADMGQVEAALPIFRQVFAKNRDWAILLQRLPPTGMLKMSPEAIQNIISACVD
jgi:uncharacterized Ntn-hydrolase superfamily protein